MPLSVGGVVANLGARLDDAAFDRWERRVTQARRSAGDAVEAKLAGDYEDRDFRQFDQRLDKARRAARDDVEVELKADSDERGFNRWTQRLDRARAASRDRVDAKLGADFDDTGFNRYNQATGGVENVNSRVTAGSRGLGVALGATAGGAGVAAVAIGGLGYAAKKSVDIFEEHEVVARRQNLVIRTMGQDAGASAEHVNELAAAMMRKTGIDDDTIVSGANVLRTFRNIRNEAGEGNDVFDRTTRAVFDLSSAMGTDAQAAAIQLGKALNDPAKQAAALSRTGTIAKADIEELKKMAEAGAPRLEQQRFLLEAVEDQFEGAAEEAATSSKKMGATFGEMAETVGEKVAPAFNTVVDSVSGFTDELRRGEGAGGRFGDRMRGVGRVVGRAWDGVRDTVRTVFRFIDRVIDENRDTLDSMGRTVRGVASRVGDAIGEIRDAFSSVFSGRSGTSRDLRTFIRAVLDIADAALKVLGAIADRALPGIVRAFRGFFQVLRGVIRLVTGVLTGDFRKAWEGIKDIFSGGIKAAGGVIRAATSPFRTAAAAVGRAVAGAFRSAWEGITDTARGFINQIIKIINLIPGVKIKPLRERKDGERTGGGPEGTGRITSRRTGGKWAPRQGAFAAGGAFGMTGGFIDSPIAVMGEEAPEFPEWVIPENPAYRERAVELWQAAGERLGVMYAKGGRAFARARDRVGKAIALARGGMYSRDELEELWQRVNPGLGNSRLMAAIALAESGGDSGIVNRIGAGGLWQIHPPEPGYLDPVTNARIAGRKLRTQGLDAWEAYTKGMHTKFLGGSGGITGALRGIGSAITRVVETAAQVAKRIVGKLPKNPGGVLKGAFKWALGRARDYIRDKAKDVLETVTGGGGGGGGAGVRTGTWAKARKLAAEFGARITSSYRTRAQNAAANGAANSSHMRGSPANPGAHDFVPPSAGLIRRALEMGAIFAENHDYGSGLHSHVSWFRRGGRSGRFAPRFGAFRGGGAFGVQGTGGRKIKPGKTKPRSSGAKKLNAGIARSVARGELGITGFEREIQDLERDYDQADRRFGLSDEIFLIEHDDGSTTVDEGAVAARLRELEGLKRRREAIKRKIEAYRRAVGRLIRTLKKAISRLKRALKAAGGKSRAKERAGYREAINTYEERIGELRGTHKDLGFDVEDQRIDLAELNAEHAAIAATKGEAAEPADTSESTVDITPSDTATAPTAAEIAAAGAEFARQQFEAFQGARADLFRTFGGNTIEAGANPFAGVTAQAAGAQHFGAASGGIVAPDARAYAGPGGTVTYVEKADFIANYPATPPDGGSYIQQQQREAALAWG